MNYNIDYNEIRVSKQIHFFFIFQQYIAETKCFIGTMNRPNITWQGMSIEEEITFIQEFSLKERTTI